MKRYDLEGTGWGREEMVEREDGDYCEYSDYEAELAKEREIAKNYSNMLNNAMGREMNLTYELAKDKEEVARLREALVKCMDRQVKIQELMRKHNYKIDDLTDPVKRFYFAIYTELCEVDAIAREALERGSP